MAASGIGINDECSIVYGQLKAKKMHRYVLFKLSADNKEIVVDETGDRDATWEDFVKKLEEVAVKKEGRYAVYDVDGPDKKNKIVFITWNPDDSKVKEKMLIASSKDAFKKKVDTGILALQWSDHDDLNYPALVKACGLKECEQQFRK